RMVAEGHQLANHTYSHANFSRLSAAKMKSEVAAVEADLFAAVGGPYTDLVRIPGGANTDLIRRSVPNPLIMWSVDPYDWKYRDEDIVYEKLTTAAFDGAVILLHDLYPTSVAAALRAIDTLQSDGYEFVTVSELFRRRGVYLQNGTVYRSALNTKGTTLPAYSAPTLSCAYREDGAAVVTAAGESPYLELHYTTDASLPTLASPLYTAPLVFTEAASLRVAGFDRFATRTPLAELSVRTATATPRVESWDGTLMTLCCDTPNAVIRYSTDGSDPRRDGGEVYRGAFEPGTTTRVVAVAAGLQRSEIRTVTKTRQGDLFYDVPETHPELDAIDTVAALGLMNGTAPYVFSPDGPTTRGALVSILYRIAGSPETAYTARFADVTALTWCAAEVEWAAQNGVVNGVDQTRFLPAAPLKREQAAAILFRYAEAEKADESVLDVYPDGASVSKYARAAFAWCLANGLLEPFGGTLSPAATATRAQMAHMVAALAALTQDGSPPRGSKRFS
ncbi:MAG: S-layer homology domain-containing protein, partial [Oscillibacter sp.]|nr:S-layer homology domain-containing protein [Oscillibacter sp.]